MFEVFQDNWRSNEEILVYTGVLSCLVPSWAQNMQTRISFRSHYDLVLDADRALDFLSYLVLQACISFCSFSIKSGASLFLPSSQKKVVAQMWRTISWILGWAFPRKQKQRKSHEKATKYRWFSRNMFAPLASQVPQKTRQKMNNRSLFKGQKSRH